MKRSPSTSMKPLATPRAMPATRPRGGAVRSRPFYATVFFLSLLTAYSLFLRSYGSAAHDDDRPSRLAARGDSHECRDVHKAADQCAFVLENCEDDEAGLLAYLSFYYCTLGAAHPVAFIIMVVWLALLFTTIGIAASDFFSVNLSTIASILGLSESLAGVTFLAFGNGSPDVFSTFAAMGSNSASMAVGELIGAASFITAVVAGSMALVREFKVARKTYVRDICFFIVAVVFTVIFLADGHLHLWECFAMIGYYVFYVVTVVGWHWYSTRRRRRREREALARRHVYGSGQSGEELAPEPYRDDPDEDGDRQVSSRVDVGEAADISALERGPRIEIQDETAANDDDYDEFGEHGRHLAAEMASSMRVLRPRGRRSNTTIIPIRPSLVGALEFRSALAHLQRERNLVLSHIPSRSYSDNQLHGPAANGPPTVSVGSPPQPQHDNATTEAAPVTRERALSAGDIPDTPSDLAPDTEDTVIRVSDGLGLGFPQPTAARARTPSPTPSYQIGGSLAPPPPSGHRGSQEGSSEGTRDHLSSLSPRLLQIRIPERRGSGSNMSSPLSPFPGFTDSPMPMTPNPHADSSDFAMPAGPIGGSGSSRRDSRYHEYEAPIDSPRPVRWWPYSVLPPPHVLLSTLFPTLQDWGEKNIWDKFVSAISVPSIFLLVITLPVVETELPDSDSESTVVDAPKPLSISNTAAPTSADPDADEEPETEWQLYRRSTRTLTHRSSLQTSPALIAIDPPSNGGIAASLLPPSAMSSSTPTPSAAGAAQRNPAKPISAIPSEASGVAYDEVGGWSRWLVAVQLFVGPLFSMFVVWANWREDLAEPGMTLVRLTLYTLLGSLVLLAVLLLTTSQDRRPKYHFLLCFLGFLISIAWISTIAGEVVGVLKAIGVILGISEALLGLTIFAAGNSVGDLIADITVARLGYPVMALAACFGGPMLNILLGIGIGGAWMIIQAANKRQAKHPERPFKHKPYKVAVGGTLMVSAIALLITLVGLLIVVPMNKWILSRKIGYGLIALWTVSTVVNVVIEMTGVWAEVS